ncbi:MAG: YicC family protein [Oscillospiraceae bacterium]|nr:YicC family protein [Oscillospiraceae bacterium]
MAIKSMTGFGRDSRIIDTREITVEIRAVNHRYNEFSARLPRAYNYLEDRLKKLIGAKVNRGKVDVNVTVHNISGKELDVTLNREIVAAYLSEIRKVQCELSIKDEFTVADVLKIPDAFTVVKAQTDEDEIWAAVGEVAQAALAAFVEMREVEGAKLKEDVLTRLSAIEVATAQVEELAPKCVEKYREKLLARMNEVLGSQTADKKSIVLEAAIFAEKTAVDEETVRLRSHIAQVRELLAKEDVVGRKLDFMVQEMNREINTIGSKAHEIEITRIVVDLKSELEKIREQIQNVE